MGGVLCKKWKMGVFCKKVENGWVFFCKKWTFSQRRVHYVQYQYFLFFMLLTHPFPPTDLCQTYRQTETDTAVQLIATYRARWFIYTNFRSIDACSDFRCSSITALFQFCT